MSERLFHPLKYAFGNKPEPLLRNTQTAKIATQKKGGNNGVHTVVVREYTAEGIDATISNIILAIQKTTVTEDVRDDEVAQKRRIEHILNSWNRFLSKKEASRLFLPLDRAVELQLQEAQISADSAGRSINESVERREAQTRAEATIAAQKESLANWVWYLTRPQWNFNPNYIALVFKSLIARSSNTLLPYPDPHSDVINRLHNAYKPYLATTGNTFSPEEIKTKLLGFSQDYSMEVAKQDEREKILREGSEIAGGDWFEFTNRDVPELMRLCANTPLCLKTEQWAKFYTSEGRNMRLFLTKPASTAKPNPFPPSIPRIALCYTGSGKKKAIYEMHGVEGANQDLENIPELAEVVERESSGYANGAVFVKRSHDIRMFIKLKNKIKHKNKLTQFELTRLYEINEKFEHLGRGGNSTSAAELRKGRNVRADVETIFGTGKVATEVGEITKDTEVFIGNPKRPLTKEFLDAIKHISHVHLTDISKFPEGKMLQMKLESTTKAAVDEALKEGGRFTISGFTRDLMNNISPKTWWVLDKLRGKKSKDAAYETEPELVSLRVQDLPLEVDKNGKTVPTTLANIKIAAQKLGLSFCPAEIGPRLRVQYTNQSAGEYLWVAMDTIVGRDGCPSVFYVSHDHGELWLDYTWVGRGTAFHPERRFVFARK